MIRSKSESVALFGAGRVGTTVAALLGRSGRAVVGVASPQTSSAERAAQRLGCKIFVDPAEMARDADIVLIGAPDPALEHAANAIAPGVREKTFVCHFSGASGTAPLVRLAEEGAETAALHPVQAFADIDTAIESLAGCAWGVTSADSHYQRAAGLVQALDGVPVKVAERDRAVWHAAAVDASNGLVALIAAAEMLLSEIGIPDPLGVLLPLARGTIGNIERSSSAAAALTGPIVRGEAQTVERHLDSLADLGHGFLGAYERIAQMILEVAQSAGRVSEEDAAAISRVLAR
ncbi:MAG: hypothetical protein QOF16_1445 [Actinomycetota bacterium]|nr:hypothetical protein [Actinomycetota bacterium]